MRIAQFKETCHTHLGGCELLKAFADTLRSLRIERNMSQTQLANISCIPVSTIRNYEQDRDGRAPTLHNLMLLADIFDVTPYYLYYGGCKEMQTNSLYMAELLSELKQLSIPAIVEIHDSEATGISLPKLSISDAVLTTLANSWNKAVVSPDRGFYRPYIEQTITRYAQNRQVRKKKFNLK